MGATPAAEFYAGRSKAAPGGCNVPRLLLANSTCEKEGHLLFSISCSSTDFYFYAMLPVQPWTATNITQPSTSSGGYFRPSGILRYNTRRDPQLCGDRLNDATHVSFLNSVALSCLVRNKIRGDIRICHGSLPVWFFPLLFPNAWKLLFL